MIRDYELNDGKLIYDLLCELEETKIDKEGFNIAYMKQFNDDNYRCLLYEEDNEIKGMINMRLEHQLHHGGIVAEIMELFVKEKYRLNGIGKKLLAEAIKIARDEGCLRIELSSSNWRTDSHRFYQDSGFIASHVNLTLDL